MLKDKINAIIQKRQAIRAMKVPSALPITPAEHDSWASSILELGKLPDNDSFRHALATMVMHLPETMTEKPKAYFISALKKAIANEIAFGVIQGLKAKEKAVGQQVEDTTATVVQEAQAQGL